MCSEHSTGAGFETREVDLENMSETFLAASPTGKVPVVVVDGYSLHESNVVNEYLDEVLDGPHLLPEDAKERARTRIWMLSADNNFYPAVFVESVGRERGFPEERVSEAREKLKATLSQLEERLGDGREYLAGDGFSLADVAHAGNFVRLRQLEEEGAIELSHYPNVAAWIGKIEGRNSFRAAG